MGTRCLNSGTATGAAVKENNTVILLHKPAVLTMCEGDFVIYVKPISLLLQFSDSDCLQSAVLVTDYSSTSFAVSHQLLHCTEKHQKEAVKLFA